MHLLQLYPNAILLLFLIDGCEPQSGYSVAGVMGTSAGALAGSLFCAGYSPQDVSYLLKSLPFITLHVSHV